MPLPPRSATALNGSQLAERLARLDLKAREAVVFEEVLTGNVPEFLRTLCPVSSTNIVEGRTNRATFFVIPDYLALGSDEDYLLMPQSPQTAQRLADALHCSLPTRKMVDAIYTDAEVKLPPTPIPPSPAMITMGVFSTHNRLVRVQREFTLVQHPLGALVAGDKKDVVISGRLATAPGKVAIYGWHQTNGIAIQPLYLGHTATWVDYSQCIRLVQDRVLVNGEWRGLAEVLADPALAGLLSDEGVIPQARYDTNKLGTLSPSEGEREGVRGSFTGAIGRTNEAAAAVVRSGPTGISNPAPNVTLRFTNSPYFAERIGELELEQGVHVQLNAPALESFRSGKPVLLVFYALPNGNSTEQSVGRKTQPGDDWHFDIQHIGAQTRFVRQRLADCVVVVAYLENSLKSWPAWRKKYGDASIPALLQQVEHCFSTEKVEVVLSSHSGGGSLIFGYLNAVERIPDEVVRIAFLDSTYAYDPARGHTEKLGAWLKASDQHRLCVLAYNDAVALMDGKPFVSPAGGTWGKSHQMQSDLAQQFAFTATTNAEFERFLALDSRAQFLLRENPERKVLHTVQVERNGFIHALLCGTPQEEQGYTYFGARAYAELIQPR